MFPYCSVIARCYGLGFEDLGSRWNIFYDSIYCFRNYPAQS